MTAWYTMGMAFIVKSCQSIPRHVQPVNADKGGHNE
uniref:Uncharacterized protein n=1 Tax=Lepeophtheirus salmonis TaxID=72036 RepID=A0A0K2VBB5_LEPSM